MPNWNEPTCEEALTHKVWFGQLMLFAQKEFSSENLYFIKVVEALEGGNLFYREYKTGRIVKKYINADGVRMINISAEVKKNIVANPCVKTLVAAKKEILKMVKGDTWNRFLKSEQYRDGQRLIIISAEKNERMINSLSESGLV